jgi:hypothetical protein
LPRLALALAQAAKDLAERRLAEPELSAAMLARELNVSVPTLQRAFSASGETVISYIRQRRWPPPCGARRTRPSGSSVTRPTRAGVARLRAAATTDTRPVIDSLDLLVLHNAEP